VALHILELFQLGLQALEASGSHRNFFHLVRPSPA
jgi:hypothetical protein